MMDDLSTPHGRLKYAREKAGYRYASDFVLSIDTAQSTYSLHEAGKRRLSAEKAKIYADGFGNCTAGWILFGGPGAPGDPSPESVAVRLMAASEPDTPFDIIKEYFRRSTHARAIWERVATEVEHIVTERIAAAVQAGVLQDGAGEDYYVCPQDFRQSLKAILTPAGAEI
jgi:hypothetical protein